MSQILEYIKIAVRNITASKGRSFLTMLGIIIGIMSVIMVITIGDAVSSSVSGELDSLGGGMIDIYVAYGQTAAEEITFDSSDFDYLMEKVPHIKGITAVTSWWGSATGPKGTFNASAMSGGSALQYYSTDPIIRGRYFTDADDEAGNHVCVMTRASAIMMFGTDDVVGLTFDFSFYGMTMPLRVIGIRADSQASLVSFGFGSDQVSLELPYRTIANAFGLTEGYSEFLVFPESNVYATEIAQSTIRLLRNRKDVSDPDLIQVQSMTDITNEISNIMNIITIFISLVAAISLLVGGIGVMNIMLVSVTERTREIGIRKALGARTGSILLQFLAEAGIITLMGGVIGIVLGIAIASAICAAIGFPAVINPMVVLLATLFSSAVGIFFGIYPARKAAKLSPIDALRYE